MSRGLFDAPPDVAEEVKESMRAAEARGKSFHAELEAMRRAARAGTEAPPGAESPPPGAESPPPGAESPPPGAESPLRVSAWRVVEAGLMEVEHGHAWRVLLGAMCADRCGLRALLESYPFLPYLVARAPLPGRPLGLVAVMALAHPDKARYGACRVCGRGIRMAVALRAMSMADSWVRLGCTHCDWVGRIEAPAPDPAPAPPP